MLAIRTITANDCQTGGTCRRMGWKGAKGCGRPRPHERLPQEVRLRGLPRVDGAKRSPLPLQPRSRPKPNRQLTDTRSRPKPRPLQCRQLSSQARPNNDSTPTLQKQLIIKALQNIAVRSLNEFFQPPHNFQKKQLSEERQMRQPDNSSPKTAQNDALTQEITKNRLQTHVTEFCLSWSQ